MSKTHLFHSQFNNSQHRTYNSMITTFYKHFSSLVIQFQTRYHEIQPCHWRAESSDDWDQQVIMVSSCCRADLVGKLECTPASCRLLGLCWWTASTIVLNCLSCRDNTTTAVGRERSWCSGTGQRCMSQAIRHKHRRKWVEHVRLLQFQSVELTL